MLVSYRWLQSYFATPLPAPEAVAEAFIFHAFEIESIESRGTDTILDVKVLPNRAHDCLSHLGIAHELGALLEQPVVVPAITPISTTTLPGPAVRVAAAFECPRYTGRVVTDVRPGPSPAWLRERLEAIGQRSINSVVDAANFVMFDRGQPLHAFDLDALTGDIDVRRARPGETLTTLDGQELTLTADDLIIADAAGPLALAGVKGGKRAEVTEQTTRVFLEAATFDPATVRRASQRHVRTDASKRFENGLAPELALEGLDAFTALLSSLHDNHLTIGSIIDVAAPAPTPGSITVTADTISRRLGYPVAPEIARAVLERLGLSVLERDGELTVTPSARRLDLTLPEDIVEEVGRVLGYDQVPLVPLPTPASQAPDGREFRLAFQLRAALRAAGFSEVYGYAFEGTGERELENPLASDKKFLRSNLSNGLALALREHAAALIFDHEPVRLFEVGHVFSADREELHLALGVSYKQKKYGDAVAEAQAALAAAVKAVGLTGAVKPGLPIAENSTACVLEVSLAGVEPGTGEPDLASFINKNISYAKPSPYPRIIRDVALWVPTETSEAEISAVIKQSSGDLLVAGPFRFDRFEKEGRVSYAFRMVFQSADRTLTDADANTALATVIAALETHSGWVVRQ